VEQLDEIASWVASRVPSDWFTGATSLDIDDYEILLVGALASEAGKDAERIERFRDASHLARAAIAREAAQRFGRRLSWGVVSGATIRYFNVARIPTTTKLQLRQRRTLDRLVASGRVQDRSEALAWCVDLAARHEADWPDPDARAVGESRRTLEDPPPPQSG
jgi:hypothetical protein